MAKVSIYTEFSDFKLIIPFAGLSEDFNTFVHQHIRHLKTKNSRRFRHLQTILFIGILLSEIYNPCTAQNILQKKQGHHSAFSIETRAYYGFINNYHNELKLFNTHLPAFEVSLIKSACGRKSWESIYQNPKIGYSLFYTSFNNSAVLGSALAIYPHIDFPLFNTPIQKANFRIGLGLAYFNKKFTPVENYQNLAIGSSFNAFVHFMFDYQFHLNDRNRLSLGMSLIHFSNGSFATPNYGLNLPMASVGYTHQFGNEPQNNDLKPYPLFLLTENAPLRIDIQAGFGLKSLNTTLGEKFPVFTQSMTVFKTINKKSSLGVGIDFSWDKSHEELLLQREISSTNLGLIKYALAANYELRLEKLALKFGIGGYVYAKEQNEGAFFEKLALNYLVYRNVYASMELKAHAARAAYLAWGLGYQLPFKKANR